MKGAALVRESGVRIENDIDMFQAIFQWLKSYRNALFYRNLK